MQGCASYAIFFLLFLWVSSAIKKVFLTVFRTCRTPTKPFSKFLGRYAVVTGATDGIGLAIAKELARLDANLYLIGRDSTKLEHSRSLILQSFPSCDVKTFTFDFSHTSWNEEKFNALGSAMREVDVGLLVNCAGISYPSAQAYDEVSSDLINNLLSVNTLSTLRLTHLLLPQFKEKRRGAILCIGSGVSEVPTEPLYAAYVASKAATEAFCRSLAVECVPHNILVQCHTPLLVATKMSRIKRESLTVLSPQKFARNSVNYLMNSSASIWESSTVCPSAVHQILLLLANSLPIAAWNRLRFSATASIRKRYLENQKKKNT